MCGSGSGAKLVSVAELLAESKQSFAHDSPCPWPTSFSSLSQTLNSRLCLLRGWLVVVQYGVGVGWSSPTSSECELPKQRYDADCSRWQAIREKWKKVSRLACTIYSGQSTEYTTEPNTKKHALRFSLYDETESRAETRELSEYGSERQSPRE